MAVKKHAIFSRKLRLGMVGGGPGSFIGDVHLKAAQLDGQVELVAGAFSQTASKSKTRGRELYLNPRRVYGSYQEMIEKESALPPEERIDFVSVVTPNNSHFCIAKDFLEAGFHVVLDKPMTMNVKEARALVGVVKKTRLVLALTHNYTGYPLVKLARDLVRQGDLGDIKKITVQYPQGWLSRAVEKSGVKQAAWRTDPKRSGAAGCMGDIGTHAENLAEYITGLKMVEICADLSTNLPGRRLDDDGNCLVRWQKKVRGTLVASQISMGEENGLSIQVYGSEKSLSWRHDDANSLLVKSDSRPDEIWRRGNAYVEAKSPAAARATRLPAGHPEGFFEAFANIYKNATETIRAKTARVKPDPLALDFPDVYDGLRGMEFIEAVVKSAKLGAKWVKLPK